MGRLGDIKRSLQRILLNKYDPLRVARSRHCEIKKFKDPRRVTIWSKVNLTSEQKKQIDDFYLTNYGEKIPHTWHRHFTAFTGNFDYQYFPELLYIPEFEHFMNRDARYFEVFSDKNVLPLIASSVGVKTPSVILSCTNGIFRDENYRLITELDALNLLTHSGEVFAKPSVDSCSGVGCEVFNTDSREEALELFRRLDNNFVIQERLKCHADLAAIYPGSVNTFRVISYIWNDRIKICPVILRIGQGGKYLDNAHAGGMFIAVDDDGTLHDTAFTEFNTQFTKHPDTGLKFGGWKIHMFPKVLEAAKRIHEAIPQVGVVNWDITLGEDGEAVLMEGNMHGGSIWLIEMAHGKAVFGDDTAEILKWTRRMKKLPLSERKKATIGRP